MKTIKQISAALLALLALAVFSVTSQAQTTNWMVYNFDTNQVTPHWGNWFGGIFNSVVWDSTMDSSNNVSSGSMKVQIHPNGGDQYVLFDGYGYYSADMYNVFTNLSFDIRFDASSAIRTNTTANDNSTGVGSLDFGDMRVGGRNNSYGQDWFYYFAIPATNGLGQPNTNWTHISIAINQSTVFTQYPDQVNIQDILFGMDAAYYGNSVIHGTQIYWVDNIQFIGPLGGIGHPPPVMSVEKTKPALRAFIGSASIYARSQLTSVDQNQSWIGAGTTYPVTYSFTFLDFPNVSQVQAHLELIPGPAYTGNAGADYGKTNCLWLQILSDGAGGYTAVVAWKTNSVNNNPNHTELSIARTNSPAGTWTLRFTSATAGTLSGPGASLLPFTITDPHVTANFGNPCVLVIGNQPNGVTSGEGLPSDYASISVTGVAGLHENDDFTTASSISAHWDLSNCDNTNTLALVTTNYPYWVKWTLPDNGFGLAVSPTVNSGPWHLPEFYNGYYDVPTPAAEGKLRWYLVPSDCLPLPIVGGTPQIGQPLLPNAFFRLSNPPPAD